MADDSTTTIHATFDMRERADTPSSSALLSSCYRAGENCRGDRFAGAGEPTAPMVARDTWEWHRYRVPLAALAGKAAGGLQQSSGIRFRTLVSLDYGWQRGRKSEEGDPHQAHHANQHPR